MILGPDAEGGMYLGTRNGGRTVLQAGDRMIWSPRGGTVSFERIEHDVPTLLLFFMSRTRSDDKRIFPRIEATRLRGRLSRETAQALEKADREARDRIKDAVRQFAELLADMHDLTVQFPVDTDTDHVLIYTFISAHANA
jgi:hypothetical protein